MSQASSLYALQQIELQVIRAQKRLAEIDAQLNDNVAVAQARQQRDAAAQPLPALRARVQDLELEIESTEAKARASDQQLYSGNVKNPKALQELQQEIEALKAWRAQLEDRLLEAMVAHEDAQRALASAQSALDRALADLQQTHSDLTAEHATLTETLARLHRERDAALQMVSPQALKAYNTLKPRRANQPVALLQGRTCTACGVEQTSVVVENAQRGDKLVPCSNCGRILVYQV